MTPVDLQMDWIISKKKYDFIGKRSLYRSDTIRENRKQLVGLLTEDPKEILEEGAQIVAEPNKQPIEMLGHVTSSYFSPTLNHCVAMALIKGGNRKIGSQLYVSTTDLNVIPVEVVKPNFIDPKNEKLVS